MPWMGLEHIYFKRQTLKLEGVVSVVGNCR